MNADLGQILVFGPLVVLFAVSALVLLVRRDLVPLAHLAGASAGEMRWFLGTALGLGVIAFSIKLAIIATLASFPERTIRPLLPDAVELRARAEAAAARPVPVTIPLLAEGLAPRQAWRVLPEAAPAPADNPTTATKVALGRRLFNDPALSANGTVSCATCHDVARAAGADGRPTAVGVTGRPGRRNTPTVFNAAFQARLFWDGRAGSLEEQALGPLVNPEEMGMPSLAAVEDRVKADPSYGPAFAAAFGAGTAIDIDRIAQAIAAYERSLVTADTPYDRFLRGDEAALTPAQKRGMALFDAVGCIGCHSGPNFSGASLIGPRSPYSPLLAAGSPFDAVYRLSADTGRAGTGARDGVWRVPSLRNVALTAPYFHNGSVADLTEAVRVMAVTQLRAVVGDDLRNQTMRLWWSKETGSYIVYEQRRLGDPEIADIVAFLHALTSDRLKPPEPRHRTPDRATPG